MIYSQKNKLLGIYVLISGLLPSVPKPRNIEDKTKMIDI